MGASQICIVMQMINTVNRCMQQNVSGAWHGVQSGQTSLNIEVK